MQLLKSPSREQSAPVMAAGATAIVTRLVAERKIHGIISFGGTQGTTLSTKVMRALPYGLPKVMVSTVASGAVSKRPDQRCVMRSPVARTRRDRPLLGNARRGIEAETDYRIIE